MRSYSLLLVAATTTMSTASSTFCQPFTIHGGAKNEERQWNKSFIKTILNELISRRYFSVLVSLARQTHGHDLCKHSKKILSTNFLIWKFYTQILHFFKMRSFKILWEWFMHYYELFLHNLFHKSPTFNIIIQFK